MSEIATLLRRSRAWLVPALACLLFGLLSVALLPHPGVQDDEVLFTGPLYEPASAAYGVKLWGIRLPVMLLSYLGAFKTWVYAGVFALFAPSVWSVRLPMVLVGVVAVWLTWAWTRRVAGDRAAAYAVVLLATDTIFILTNTFDWGPVAFQHALLMGGLLAVQSWLEDESKRWLLSLGFFLWGLGLWDKALMVWPLVGLAVAAICVYPRRFPGRLRPAPVAIAAASFLLGALPLVVYNTAGHGHTFSGNTKLSLDQLKGKLAALHSTVDGSGLFDYMVSTSPGPIAQLPKTPVEQASVALRRYLGPHPRNWTMAAVALSLLCFVLLARSPRFRLLAFLLVATAVAWLQMALNAGTGGSAHHTILLWPLPCIFMGVALAGIAERLPRPGLLAMNAFIALMAIGGLLNTNEYLAEFTLNGGARAWTDASYRLARAVLPYRSRWIGGVDWGYLNGLRLWYEGDLKVFTPSDPVRKPAMSEADRAQVAAAVSDPGFVFIQHTDEDEIFPGVNRQFREAARSLGYAEHVDRVVHDNQGRPVFAIFHFEKISP